MLKLKTYQDNQWEYIIRYEECCSPIIEEEYQAIPEKEQIGNAKYVNGVLYGDREVNVLKYKEMKVKKGKVATIEFVWFTSFRITNRNAKNNWPLQDGADGK